MPILSARAPRSLSPAPLDQTTIPAPSEMPVVYFQCTGGVELREVSMRPRPGASKNTAITTASSINTRSPIAELRILPERGSSHWVTGFARVRAANFSPTAAQRRSACPQGSAGTP